VAERVGVYDPHILIRRLCDWDQWLRIAKVGSIGHTDVLIGEATGLTTTDSLGRTASIDQRLTEVYMSLDRDALLLPDRVLSYPVDGLEIFGKDPPPSVIKRAALQFSAFYRQIGDQEQAGMWERRAASEQRETPRVAAVVILYRPTEDVLANVDSYRDQVDSIIAVDNTETPDERFLSQLESRGVMYVSLGDNRGIAAALNEGCRRARALGFDWAITFDQDSTATPGMVARLSDCVELEEFANRQRDGDRACERSRDQLLPRMNRIAIVAPVWQQVDGLPVPTARGFVDLDVALTSGSLTNLSAFEELGGFREDLFIDRVDTEYCMRAQRNGWRVVQQQDALLLQRMGQLRRVTFPVQCWVTDYSPLRRYYMVRNILEVRREYGREFPVRMEIERQYWRRELAKIMLAEPQRLKKALMMIQGWLDYRSGQFGKYEDLHPR
jgi:rhamnosyltransferase